MGIARQYETQQVHYIRREFAYNTTGIANGVLIGTLPAGARVIGLRVFIDTAFAGGTPSVQGGTTGTGTNLFTNTDSAPTVVGPKTPASAAGQAGGLVITADQDLFVSSTGTGGTAGTGCVTVEFIPLTNGG